MADRIAHGRFAKVAAAILLAALIAILVGGCGGETNAEQAGDAASAIERLAAEAKGDQWQLDAKISAVGLTHTDLQDVSGSGVDAGEGVHRSIRELVETVRDFKLLEEEELEFLKSEIKSAACYIYTWHLENPGSGISAEVEFGNYLESKLNGLLSSMTLSEGEAFLQRVEGAVAHFNAAVETASSPEEATVNVAIVAACS
jgi:hypothetical protein